MGRKRKGFTLVEVSLFLALTGLLFVGVTLGMRNSITQQRYNDSVQSFAEFLRTAYSGVTNVQGVVGASGGKTDRVIYGKLISFGESKNLDGEENSSGDIYIYDVIGKDVRSSGSTLDALKNAEIDVVVEDGGGNYVLAGTAEEYIPRWNAAIQSTDEDKEYMKGAVLIVRHPSSGTVSTYVSETSMEINKKIGSSQILTIELLSSFSRGQIDFCVNPGGNVINNNRRNVRIVENARNSAGVEVIGLDENKLNNGVQVGNRCRYGK